MGVGTGKYEGKYEYMAVAAVPGVLGPATGVCDRVLIFRFRCPKYVSGARFFFEELGDLSTDTNDNYFGVYLLVRKRV